jgi:hypothetical protein
MLELLVVLAFVYLLTVGISFALIKLVWDEIPTMYAFLPVLNLAILVVGGGSLGQRRGGLGRLTPGQEIDRERARHGTFWPPFR